MKNIFKLSSASTTSTQKNTFQDSHLKVKFIFASVRMEEGSDRKNKNNCYLKIQQKLLKVITLEQSETDNNKQIIIRNKSTKHIKYNVKWSVSVGETDLLFSWS